MRLPRLLPPFRFRAPRAGLDGPPGLLQKEHIRIQTPDGLDEGRRGVPGPRLLRFQDFRRKQLVIGSPLRARLQMLLQRLEQHGEEEGDVRQRLAREIGFKQSAHALRPAPRRPFVCGRRGHESSVLGRHGTQLQGDRERNVHRFARESGFAGHFIGLGCVGLVQRARARDPGRQALDDPQGLEKLRRRLGDGGRFRRRGGLARFRNLHVQERGAGRRRAMPSGTHTVGEATPLVTLCRI